MSPPAHEVDRLDFTAKAIMAGESARRGRWPFLVLNLILAVVAVGLLRQRYGPWHSAVLTICAVLAAAIMWSNWRFRLYIYGGWWVALALAALLIKTSAALPDRLYVALGGGIIGFYTLTQAGSFATASTPEWGTERARVEEWWRILSAPGGSPDVVEFSTKSFTRGNFLYRLMKPGPFWVVMKKYRGWAPVSTSLRVRELSDVTLQFGQEGDVTAIIGGKTVRGVNCSRPPWS